MTISANLHVLCSSADSSVQEIKANGSIPRSKGIHFKLFARTQTILFDLLIRQQTTSITVCDGIRMAGDQMAISAHASLLHALTSFIHLHDRTYLPTFMNSKHSLPPGRAFGLFSPGGKTCQSRSESNITFLSRRKRLQRFKTLCWMLGDGNSVEKRVHRGRCVMEGNWSVGRRRERNRSRRGWRQEFSLVGRRNSENTRMCGNTKIVCSCLKTRRRAPRRLEKGEGRRLHRRLSLVGVENSLIHLGKRELVT